MFNLCGNCFCESLNDRGICTRCGFRGWENKEKYPLALVPGSILNGRYIIGKVLGQGGFGITYTARDHQTGQIVAIKEFFPDSMVTRSNHTAVTPYTGERGENFGYGKDTFLLEAKTMAEFIGCPNIVRVYSYFEENGTGYFVMEYVDGQSFQSYLKENFGRIPWEDALRILLPVMDALSIVHEKGIIHRDIAPDNICIAKDGTVKLLDFGAARYSLGNVSQSLDVVLRHGFAPKEQYKRHGRQGPYTDIYALGATFYYAITGTRPDDAIERLDEDTLPLPSTLGANVTEAQEDVILKAMAIQPEDRYRSVAEFKAALTNQAPRPAPKPVPEPEPKPVPRHDPKPEPAPVPAPKAKLPKWLIPAGAAAVLVLGVVLGTALGGDKEEKKLEVPATEAPVQTTYAETTIPMETEPVETKPPIDQSKNILMSVGEGYLYEKSTFLHLAGISRNQVRKIKFYDTLDNAPKDAEDVSLLNNGQVLAWHVYANEQADAIKLYDVYIAAEGPVIAPEDSSNLFSYLENLKTIDFGGNFDTSHVKNMEKMFYLCESLEDLDVSCFNTERVTNMSYMFYACRRLTIMDLSNFDTSNVETMNNMFNLCNDVEEIDVSSFDTSKVIRMDYMFNQCSDLCYLDISNFDLQNVTDLSYMFGDSRKLENVIITDSRPQNVLYAGKMFVNCPANKPKWYTGE